MRPARRQRGVALIMVLWLTIMLTVIGAGFAYGMRNEVLAARNGVSIAQARAIADGAVYRTVFELLRPKVSPDVWTSDGSIHEWAADGARISVTALDESGKIDLNSATDEILKGLFRTAAGLDEDRIAHLVDAIGDWRDADDLRRPNGAEAQDYKAAGSPFVPANAAFETVPELQRVLGMTPAIYAAVADSLTVHSRQAGVNPLYATRTTLLALPGATADVIDRYIADRDAAVKARTPPPAFPLAVGTGALNLWRIRASVVMDDGVRFVREAVIRPGDQRRLLTVLEWQDATQGSASSASGANAAPAASATAAANASPAGSSVFTVNPYAGTR
jgi:general secretion pathway protein K